MIKRQAMFSLIVLVMTGVVSTSAGPAAAGPATTPAQSTDTPRVVGWMSLSGPLPDEPTGHAWLANNRRGHSLRRVVECLEAIAKDDRYLGLVVYLDDADLGLAQVNEISRAIRSIRNAGRKVLVFAQSYDLMSYTLACQADKILLQRNGSVQLTGIHVEEMYVAGLLEKVGLKADLLQIGQFKGAREPLTRTSPSPAWNETMDRLINDIYGMVLEQIAQGRQLDRQAAEKVLETCWEMTDAQYLQHGVVDYLTDRDLAAATAVEFGTEFEWEELFESDDSENTIENPLVLFRALFQESRVRIRRPTLAVIRAAGPITRGESRTDGAFGSNTVGSGTVSRALREATDNEHIKGVLIRVDSPGGSALASEVLWQAVHRLAQTKPVFVSIGSTAASGGYYIATAGDQIYACAGSIVGSIGVVGGKIVLGELYDKIGVSVYRRTRGPLADMFNSVEPFTDAQRAVIEAAFQRTYDQFTERVATGRANRVDNIDAVAHGRIFTGRMAVANGLVDKLGGMDRALADLSQAAGLAPGSYDVINLPPPPSLSQILERWFQWSSVQGAHHDLAVIRAAQAALGDRLWRGVHPILSGLILLQHEPTLMLMPMGIVVR